MKTRIRSFLMAMLLVLSLTATSLAAGAGSAADLYLYAEQVSDNIVLGVYLTAEDSTNGRIAITYDHTKVTLVEVSTNDAWVTSVNSATPGEVSFAWVGSAMPVTDEVMKLVFQINFQGMASVVFDGNVVELYKNGLDMIGEATVADSETILINGSNGGTTFPPVIPTPQPPVDDNDDEEEETGRPGIELDVPELTEERYNSIVTQYPDAEDHWAEENIVKAINAGLFNGTSENAFTPNGVVTRGMFVTLLYRMSGEPAVSGTTPFTDVPASQYYADAVKWAYTNNIVGGVSATEFAPNKEMTREQMVTMLYRFANYTGDDTSKTASLYNFGDAGEVSGWASDAMRWAVAEGIITGSNGNLNPADASTRAQIATVLVRYAGL